MNRTRLALVTAVCITFLSIGACVQSESGSPLPVGTEPSTASKDVGRPEVSAPKNLEAVGDPCQLLRPEQLQQIGTTGATVHGPSAWGEDTCTWGVDADGLQINIAPAVTTNYGLARVLQTTGKPAPDENVEGYPGVIVDPAMFTCGIYVAVSAEDVFGVAADRGDSDRPEHQDPCAVAKQVASMVLSNLPAQS
ncbi:DUF3558 domain-containing protein [Saccharopolyspora sp. 5N708]|uniref:DUF3558 domain-containing protein n=1 Tax=Saccharopolyspora sp. 5N708 TaxID=3457424 RepID=UPI003FCF93BD